MTAEYETRLPSAYASAQPSKSSPKGVEPALLTSCSPNEPQGRSQAGTAAGSRVESSGLKPSGESLGEGVESTSAAPCATAPGPIKIERLRAAARTRL